LHWTCSWNATAKALAAGANGRSWSPMEAMTSRAAFAFAFDHLHFLHGRGGRELVEEFPLVHRHGLVPRAAVRLLLLVHALRLQSTHSWVAEEPYRGGPTFPCPRRERLNWPGPGGSPRATCGALRRGIGSAADRPH
jgi:hypothetical protein